MRSSSVDPAFVACKFIVHYNALWDRFFPQCTGRAHWHIVQLLRISDDGLPLSRLRGKLYDVHGMDENTCAERLKELIASGLLLADGQNLRASSVLTATPAMIKSFDLHTVEAVELLYETARTLDPRLPQAAAHSPSAAMSKRFVEFFQDVLEIWDDHRRRFLKVSLPKSPAIREKAMTSLKRYAYWHIFLTAWMHAHPTNSHKRGYLLIDDFHAAIYTHSGVSQTATTRYVKDLIAWDSLSVLEKNRVWQKVGSPFG